MYKSPSERNVFIQCYCRYITINNWFIKHYLLLISWSQLYELVIEARDQGTPALTGTTTATVTVTDVNDNAPLFTNAPFAFTVDEHAANDTVVGTVTAVDYDIGEYL